MKCCFILYGNLYLTPYIQNYLDVFSKEECDIICWDRHGIEEHKVGCRVISFGRKIKDNKDGKLKKLLGYLQYTKFVRQKIRKTRYDIVICLQSIGGVCLSSTLLKYYKNKYIIDVRDYSIEGVPFLRNIEFKLLRSSCLNVISSNGYRNFLPKDCEYQIVHNYSCIPENIRQVIISKRAGNPIILSYIGLIRFQEQNQKMIDLFAGDDRFILRFIGKNALELKKYIVEHNILNVELTDQFPPEQTLDYYAQTDAVLNVYGNHTPLLDYALSNKLYFAASLHLPIIVSKHTYMEKISVENGFGFVLDFEDAGIKDKLYEYIMDKDLDAFAQKCEMFMGKVKRDNDLFAQELNKLKEKQAII